MSERLSDTTDPHHQGHLGGDEAAVQCSSGASMTPNGFQMSFPMTSSHLIHTSCSPDSFPNESYTDKALEQVGAKEQTYKCVNV